MPDLSQLSVSVSQNKVFEKGPRVVKEGDRNALEAALKAKEEAGLTLAVFMLGNSTQEKILREALALGADQAHLIQEASIPSHSTAISWAFSRVLKEAGPFDLVFTGGPEGSSPASQVEFRLAESLGFSLLWNIEFLKIEGPRAFGSLEGKPVESELPALLSIRKGSNAPRIPNVMRIMKAAKASLVTWDLKEALEKSGCSLFGEQLVRSTLAGK